MGVYKDRLAAYRYGPDEHLYDWMKGNEASDDDSPFFEILLCVDRNELYVKYASAGMENLVLAGRFALPLPDPEQLSKAVAEVLQVKVGEGEDTGEPSA